MKRKEFIRNSSLAGIGLATIPSFLSCKNEAEEKVETPQANTEGAFKLSPLPYAYDAFTDVIDARTMEIHYTKHHQGYADKLNAAIKEENLTKKSIEDILAGNNLSDAVRNNGGGYYNHNLYWDILTPGGKEMPADFAQKITSEFGSKDALITQLIDAGKNQFGSGWAWLIKDNSGKLKVTSTPNQDNPLMATAEEKGLPLLGIDVWEHAYYLKYQNKRPDYLKNIFNIINWENVAKRLS